MLNHQLPFAKKIPANGTQGLLTLSHSRGSPHLVNALRSPQNIFHRNKSLNTNNLQPSQSTKIVGMLVMLNQLQLRQLEKIKRLRANAQQPFAVKSRNSL